VLAVRRLLFLLLLGACTPRDRAAPAPADAAPETAAPSASASQVVQPEAPPPPPREPVDAAVPVLPQSAWVWKTYKGDHYSVLFPGEPRVSELPAEEDKAGYSQALLDVPGGQVSFAAGYTEHTAEEVAKPDAFLDERANAPRRGFTEVLHKRSVTLPGGQPGRVLIQRRNLSGTPLRVYSRLYLAGRRLYALIVSTLDVGGISEDAVKKFMDSFKLL
jgi:hypothetical protein